MTNILMEKSRMGHMFHFLMGAVLGYAPQILMTGANWWDPVGIYIISYLMIFGPLRKRAKNIFSRGRQYSYANYPVVYGYLLSVTAMMVTSIAIKYGPKTESWGELGAEVLCFFILLDVSYNTLESFYKGLAKKG